MWCGSSLRLASPALALALALAAGPRAKADAITGVCPDGSIFIVQKASAVPCRGAKLVEPDEVPPLRPEFLPRPYGWDQFQRETNPNNPYNQVGQGSAAPRAAAAPPPQAAPPQPAPAVSAPPAPQAAPTPVQVARAAPNAPLELGLAPGEVAQLASIVEAWQERAPATLVRPGGSAPQGMLLRVARSAALEARVAEALARRGAGGHGPVLAFQVVAQEPGSFFANLTFVQGHVAFHPDVSDPRQLGLLAGAQGPLAAGQSALGYVVLPAHVDLARPLDVYWDDRRITATLQPQS
jgi:hypothetical protein